MIKCEDGRCSYCGDGAHYEPDVRAERDALKAALRGLLLSADAIWEERNLGHDWREAVEAARAALGGGE